MRKIASPLSGFDSPFGRRRVGVTLARIAARLFRNGEDGTFGALEIGEYSPAFAFNDGSGGTWGSLEVDQ